MGHQCAVWARRALVAAAVSLVLQGVIAVPTGAQCVGDCDGDGTVSVDEILTSVSIALSSAGLGACIAGDANRDGTITVDEIVGAVHSALTNCPQCGGVAGRFCPRGAFCEFPIGRCGAGGIGGVCRAIPEPPCICTYDVNPVCGCDGQTYTNACGATCAGVSIAHIGACGA